ncbi:MAG: hypothetical protein ACO3EP_04980, partial [Phycisphaerales bacterium]
MLLAAAWLLSIGCLELPQDSASAGATSNVVTASPASEPSWPASAAARAEAARAAGLPEAEASMVGVGV